MALVPDMWRVELLHPMAVHFPIALLICGTLVRVVGQFVDADGRLGFLKPAGRTAILAGALLAWLAVYTGDLANVEVARSLCDPRVKKSHEDLAHLSSYIFSAAIIVDLGAAYFDPRPRLRRLIITLSLLAYLTGASVLGYTGHLGAQLVYQQAAGVYHPTGQCTEFGASY